MSNATKAGTATRIPARPQAPSRPASPQQQETRTHKEENARRVRDAYRAYVLARYEWFRLRAVGLGYLTLAGYIPLPLKGDEQLADIGAKTKALQTWLKNNDPEEAPTPSPQLEPEEASAREPKVFPIPPKAPRVPCRSCGAPMVFAPTQGGRVIPLNLDGTSHFATCPNADAHRTNGAIKPTAKMSQPQPPKAGTPDVPDHIRRLADVASEMGLSHAKPHRVGRLALTNVFLMANEREPVDTWRDIKPEDEPLVEEGLRTRALHW